MASYDPNIGGTETLTGTGSGSTGTGTDLKHRASEAASQVKDRAAEMGRTAVDKLEKGRSSAASALQSTASALRSKAGAEGRVGEMANRAADKIEGAASYMREHDVRDMMGDFEGTVRRNPGPSLLIAAAFGFLLGSALRGGSTTRSRY